MIRLFYSAGAARIVEIQLNSLKIRKSTGAPTAPSATSANRAAHGSQMPQELGQSTRQGCEQRTPRTETSGA